MNSRIMLAIIAIFLTQPLTAQESIQPTLVESIRREATRPSSGGEGRPLPLACHWNMTGMYMEGFTPAYQMELLKKGHHILPWLGWPPTDADLDANFKAGDPRRQKYIDGQLKEIEKNIKELARLKLPISFLATQWESTLTYNKAFFNLPPEQNPNSIGLDGKIKGEVCPFGPIEPWREVGKRWTDNLFMKKIQEWYPDPPLILLISNNEHARLQWSEAEKSKRYLDKYGKGQTGEFKRKVIGDGWIERYGAMMDSMRAGLVNNTWKKNVRFIGYEAFPPVHFGRWGGWKEYSLAITNRLDPQPTVWDGGSPSYYLHNWMAITDFNLWSPQVETMNWVFMLDEIHKTRPNFWFELSTWDGNDAGQANDKRKFYARQGKVFSPERYEGMVQYGMWLMRPRTVREFRSHVESVEYAGPYFKPILDAVDRVYKEPILEKFWRKGELVVNPRGKHPYQADLPKEHKDAARWFLLETNLTPKALAPEEFDNAKPPQRQLEISVYALALVMGDKDSREWLVFAHSPKFARNGVAINVPGFGSITVDVPQSGSFWHLSEKGHAVKPVVIGGPASFRLEAPQFVEVGEPATFSVKEKYSPRGKLDAILWKVGDRVVTNGDTMTHRFDKAGQFVVTASGHQGFFPPADASTVVFVGIKPQADLVCHFLMKGSLQVKMKSWVWLGGWDKCDYDFLPDASGKNNMGFLEGGAFVKDEQRGRVLELDGKHDRIEIANSADINASEVRNRTIAFWFKPKPLPVPTAKKTDKKKSVRQVVYEEGGPGSGINVYLDDMTLFAGAWHLGKGTWLEHKEIKPDTWNHVALVLRSAAKTDTGIGVELYLNGQKVANGKAPVVGAHTGDVNVGRAGNTLFPDNQPAQNPGYYFGGRLDDFRIMNRALAPEEVRELAK